MIQWCRLYPGHRAWRPNATGTPALSPSMGVMTQQLSDAPSCSCSHADYESYVDQAYGEITLAPALEHRDESSEEENDGDDGESFEPHVRISRGRAWHRERRRESAGVTTRRDSLLRPPNVNIEIFAANHSAVSVTLVVLGIMLIHLRC